MKSSLIRPDGQPVQQTVTVTNEQALAVVGRLFEAEIAALINNFRIQPPVVAENLIRMAASLLAMAQPPQARQVLTLKLSQLLQTEVARIAGAVAVDQAVAGRVMNGRVN